MSHKWWHNFFFVNVTQESERSTSYCGKYLWHHFEMTRHECTKCGKFSLNLKDHKEGKHIKLKWVDFSEVTKAIKDIRGEK